MHEVKLKYRAVTSFDAGLVYAPYTPLDIAKEILSVQPMFGLRRPPAPEPKKYKPIDLATLRGLP